MALKLKKKQLINLSQDIGGAPNNGNGVFWSDTLACMTWLWHSCASECLCEIP